MERITYSRNWESQTKNEAIYEASTTGMKIAATIPLQRLGLSGFD
jgi:hypothetical protein